jgi:hypothetical protein
MLRLSHLLHFLTQFFLFSPGRHCLGPLAAPAAQGSASSHAAAQSGVHRLLQRLVAPLTAPQTGTTPSGSRPRTSTMAAAWPRPDAAAGPWTRRWRRPWARLEHDLDILFDELELSTTPGGWAAGTCGRRHWGWSGGC